MASLDSTERAKVALAAGESLIVTTTGQCTVQGLSGAPSSTTTLTANSQTFGPYGVSAVLLVTSVSGRTDYVADNATFPLSRTEKASFNALVSAGGILAATPWGRPSFVLRPAGGAVQSSATVQTQTEGILLCSPVPYYAARLSYTHLGGNGGVTGFKALIGASDDGGSRDLTSLADANLRKACNPRKGGTAYNTVVSDGSPGWSAVTWAGAASIDIADPGAGKRTTVTSDMVYVRGMVDANGLYPLLVRYYYGTGAFTYVPFLTGQAVGANLATDLQGAYICALNRGGTDAVATPTNWGEGNGPNASASVGNLTLEVFGPDPVLSVHVVGDSRFAVSSETSGTKAYLSFEVCLQNALWAAGKKASVIRGGISGGTSAVYQPGGLAQYGAPPAKWLVYLVYTVNDGAPTDATVGLALARATEIVQRARDAGQKVLLIPAFPNGATYTAPQLAQFSVVKAWCSQVADVVFDPLATYGNAADGSWQAGINFDASHMLNASYRDMAMRVAALLTA